MLTDSSNVRCFPFERLVEARTTSESRPRPFSTKLLVCSEEGTAPKILDYAGRGPLEAWLRVAAAPARAALDRKRKDVRRSEEGDIAETAGLDYLSSRLDMDRACFCERTVRHSASQRRPQCEPFRRMNGPYCVCTVSMGSE